MSRSSVPAIADSGETEGQEQFAERVTATMRAATRDTPENVPWLQRFQRFDTDKSGLLSPKDFYRCVRRYCKVDVLSDHDIHQLLAIVDADHSGEISIEEFEVFLHEAAGFDREVAAAARIQARWRGRRARESDTYHKSVSTLQRRADSQAEALKRRIRSVAAERVGLSPATTTAAAAAAAAALAMCVVSQVLAHPLRVFVIRA
jgi:hypothetical protein